MALVLKLHGKPFDPKPPTPSITAILAILDKCPKDEIFAHREIALKAGLNDKYLTHRCREPRLQPYTVVVNRQRYFGHKAAIAELKRQMGVK